jgi:hypothetical protein
MWCALTPETSTNPHSWVHGSFTTPTNGSELRQLPILEEGLPVAPGRYDFFARWRVKDGSSEAWAETYIEDRQLEPNAVYCFGTELHGGVFRLLGK